MHQFSKQEELRAEQVRVTPEELVEAMSVIEALRERESLERNRTISIGEAIDELGLQATPEELLAAVAATRVRREQPEVTATVRTSPLPRQRKLPVALALGFSLLTAPILLYFLTSSSPAAQLSPPTVIEMRTLPRVEMPIAPPAPRQPVVPQPRPSLDGVLIERDSTPRVTGPAVEVPPTR